MTGRAPAVNLDAGELRRLLEAQRAAFLAEGPPTVQVRRNRIDRLALAVLDHADALTAALHADFGSRPELVSLTTDLLGALPDVHLVRDSLEAWMQDEEVPAGAAQGMPTQLQVRPKGVVGVIGPWNFPVSLVFQPAVEALAAGNRVMIKFSEVASQTAAVFAEAVARAFDPAEVVVVRGGPATAAAFSSLPLDHLFFTGSTPVGRKVAAAAGANLVPVTLELGGKNPVVVGPGADLPVVAERVAAQRMLNAGQVCLCPDDVFVPTGLVDGFVAACREQLARFFPSYADDPGVVSVVDDANFARISALVDDARSKGATVHPVGSALPDAGTRRLPPVVIVGVTADMAVAQEEVFGPVLVVHAYSSLDEVVDHLNARPAPLAAYWYGDDGTEYRDFLRRTTSGGVTRNDMALHHGVPGAPFGGVGASGHGAYHGRVGFETFSHRRTVTVNALPFGVAPSMMPPYSDGTLAKARGRVQSQRELFRMRLSAD
ncbi:MAG: aldehyde dehydrogenase dependent [Frankiales bacterium]|nr:aldehyde dehydrogenase dependent [Frankiales bacterium]